MKILAFTDIHASVASITKIKAASKKADLLICTGDFTVFGSHLKRVIKDFASMGKKMLIVHGNHEDEDEVAEECKKYDNLYFLYKNFYEEDGIVFAGYGGGGFAQEDKNFEKFSKEITSRRKGKKLVLLFHMPPYGTKTDHLSMGYVGSMSYTEYIKKEKPDLVLCGHLHENFGKMDKIGKSIIFNPGPNGSFVEIKTTDTTK